MAAGNGVSRLPRPYRPVDGDSAIDLADLHPAAHRPGRARPAQKKVEYISDRAQRAKIGQIQDASQTAEYEDVLRQESDLTAGHGVVRYTGLIAVTAPTVDELDTAVAAIEQAAIQASCETRRLVGQQAAAFTAAALPIARRI